MGWFIFFAIIILLYDPEKDKEKMRRKEYERRMRQHRKELRRAEMDAFEDMIMYMEVFSDD